jgi:hypothetical protein
VAPALSIQRSLQVVRTPDYAAGNFLLCRIYADLYYLLNYDEIRYILLLFSQIDPPFTAEALSLGEASQPVILAQLSN